MSAKEPSSENAIQKVELGYCPRCGALRTHNAAAAGELCESCQDFAAWVRSGCQRPKRRSPRRARKEAGGRP